MEKEVLNIKIEVGNRYRCYDPLSGDRMVLKIMSFVDGYVTYCITGSPSQYGYGPSVRNLSKFKEMLMEFKCNIFQKLD